MTHAQRLLPPLRFRSDPRGQFTGANKADKRGQRGGEVPIVVKERGWLESVFGGFHFCACGCPWPKHASLAPPLPRGWPMAQTSHFNPNRFPLQRIPNTCDRGQNTRSPLYDQKGPDACDGICRSARQWRAVSPDSPHSRHLTRLFLDGPSPPPSLASATRACDMTS